ncbi:MAG: hypothetical protein OXK79_07300 [Chloroflexota bacterium]|nr:hypothetical protein [Chloroflexota bacterium]
MDETERHRVADRPPEGDRTGREGGQGSDRDRLGLLSVMLSGLGVFFRVAAQAALS